MRITEEHRSLLAQIGDAIETKNSKALHSAAAQMEALLRGKDDKVHKAAHVLSIMGRVRDTMNTQKVYDYLRTEFERLEG